MLGRMRNICCNMLFADATARPLEGRKEHVHGAAQSSVFRATLRGQMFGRTVRCRPKIRRSNFPQGDSSGAGARQAWRRCCMPRSEGVRAAPKHARANPERRRCVKAEGPTTKRTATTTSASQCGHPPQPAQPNGSRNGRRVQASNTSLRTYHVVLAGPRRPNSRHNQPMRPPYLRLPPRCRRWTPSQRRRRRRR